WAGTVAAPGLITLAAVCSTIARSMSVAVRLRRSPLASTSTLDRMGIVLRRSTTLCTWARERNKAVRSMVSFMASHAHPIGRSEDRRQLIAADLLDGLFSH